MHEPLGICFASNMQPGGTVKMSQHGASFRIHVLTASVRLRCSQPDDIFFLVL